LALVLPAMLGGAGAVEVRLLERLALFWGVSYQILDDLKDLRCSPGATGKTGARDLPLGRPNLVVEIGGAGAARQLHRLLALADQAVDRLVAPAPHLAYLEAICRRFREEVAVLDPAVAPA
jgi:geranylgeranyl pyrophosphate synthase